MPGIFDKLKQYGGLLGKGLMLEMAPGIAGGVINELFRQEHITVATVIKYVENNQSLWDRLPDIRDQLAALIKKVGNLDFITPDFLINSIKKDFPGVASLFVNWEPAMKWLTEQIEDIKSKIQE